MKLRKIYESVNELKETLKYFDKTNESLIKVQRLSEGVLGKMDAMKGEMVNSYDDIDEL
jgi:Ca2+-binding EF-hand superfamily protein